MNSKLIGTITESSKTQYNYFECNLPENSIILGYVCSGGNNAVTSIVPFIYQSKYKWFSVFSNIAQSIYVVYITIS